MTVSQYSEAPILDWCNTTHSCWIYNSRTNLLSNSNHYRLQKRGTNIQSRKWHQVHSNTPFSAGLPSVLSG